MKGLILCALLLTGCGGNIIPTDLEAHTPLIWSPVAGVVITESTASPGLYEVAVDCRSTLTIPEMAFSDLAAPCSISDFTGTAYILTTRQQLIDLGAWLREYMAQ